MHQVQARSLAEYLAADSERRSDLEELDSLIRLTAPELCRWFYAGVRPGEPGMAFKMIGYGVTTYRRQAGTRWPIIGVALQKSYISVYIAARKSDRSVITEDFRGRLGESRMGKSNFSFKEFRQLRRDALVDLLTEVVKHSAAGAGSSTASRDAG